MENVRELEPLLVELALRGTDAATTSFASILEVLTAKTGGNIEFDVRINRDAQIQRLASVAFAEGRRVLLALSADGQHVLQLSLADSVHEDFFHPLANWFALPLREKPYVNIDAETTLLVGALRSKGLLPTADV